jgi:hypothetical protein
MTDETTLDPNYVRGAVDIGILLAEKLLIDRTSKQQLKTLFQKLFVYCPPLLLGVLEGDVPPLASPGRSRKVS